MSETDNNLFNRFELLVGRNVLKSLQSTKVIIFGIGGVGSWTAEGLVRSGVGYITIVDSDIISTSNVNRQIHATFNNVGNDKVTELKKRLLEINPNVSVTAINENYNKLTSGLFKLSSFDYVIDAIDSLSSKVTLIQNALDSTATLYSSLGASAKLDPTQIKISSIWDTIGCRLGRFVRKKLRNRGVTKDFLAIYSPERRTQIGIMEQELSIKNSDTTMDNDVPKLSSPQTLNGSAVHITSVFGMYLCSLVLRDIAGEL